MLRVRTVIMLTFRFVTKSCVTPWDADTLHGFAPNSIGTIWA